MTIRHLVWHIPHPGFPLPRFYIDGDSQPIALRIYAENAPSGGDFLVDVLDDGVSIMNSNDSQKWTFKNEDAYIEFGTPSGTFTVNETVTGGTSGATARVKANAFGHLTITDVSGTFSAAETITGGTSSATGVVGTYVRAVKNYTRTIVAGRSHAVLADSSSSNPVADDFNRKLDIRSGSWLSLSVLEANGASNVTVQLELFAPSDSEETRRAIGRH